MRRLLFLIAVIFSLSSLAAAPSFGYSLAPVGVSLPSGSYGGITASVIFAPSGESHFGDIALSVDLAPAYPFFEGVSLVVSTPVFRAFRHPFEWAFNNDVVWAPVINAGGQYRLGNEWNVLLGLSPFVFQSTHFVYEFLSAYASYTIDLDKWGWGLYIFRFSYFF